MRESAPCPDLVERARAGDEDAFEQLVGPHRRELQLHCYRFLGSLQDAEDVLQEVLLAAWRGLGTFEERASVRTWLYRVATNRCLNALRGARRRPAVDPVQVPGDPPEPTRLGEITWLQPYPQALLDGIPDAAPGPDARYEAREAVSLAFVTALQLLPPRQRAVLILRDVLGYPAREVADLLRSTEESVTSALKRARATIACRAEPAGQPPPAPGSTPERDLVERLTRAFETRDVDGVVALLTEDTWLTMPPIPLEYQGRDLCARFHAAVTFRPGRRHRLIHTRANGQPAFGLYSPDPSTARWHAHGLVVLTLAGTRISAMTRFDNTVLAPFGLPRTLRD
jgi:RNA polymerase sigma-70 factor (TIGR02960 family)